jgi:hypothetical protein
VVSTLVLPIGHDLGAFHPGHGRPPVRQVRLGGELVELSAGELHAWTLAHGLVEENAVLPSTHDVLVAEAGAAAVAGLLERGLLAEAEPGTAESVAFAEAHRLLPLAVGLGNSAQEPWMFSVGLLYQPLAVLIGALFDLWQWAHLSPDLWLACRELAEVATRSDIDDAELTDPGRVLAGALSSLHQLLAARVACLDVRGVAA